MANGLEVLKERGFIKQCTDYDKLNDLMDTENISFYVGIDPTGRSLHVGHMVPLLQWLIFSVRDTARWLLWVVERRLSAIHREKPR